MPLAAGTRLGPYEILAPLGAGGMGEVYRARDPRLGREVALKVLPEEISLDADRVSRFEQEARSASALNHPNIITIYEIGRAERVSFIAMELVVGKTLRELSASEPLPVRRVLQIAVQVAEGLAKAHGAGIVHRDLKPENVMVSKDGYVKILDFGLAKLVEPESGALSAIPTLVRPETHPGTVLGTVGYMSPEQASGQPLDFRSDQFSFGSILYEIASGQRAFARKTAVETMSAIIREEPEPLAKVCPEVPPPLRWIVERCLAKDPEERYASTRDLARDLVGARDHISESAETVLPSVEPRRKRHPILLAAGILAVGIAAGGLAVKTLWIGAPKAPSFHRLTFRNGVIANARFAPDGQTVVYGATWVGEPLRLYLARLDGPESRPFDYPLADLLSISSSGEMAILLGQGTDRQVLALAPLTGGAAREVVEGIPYTGADWAPNGKDLAIVRDMGNAVRLEYPIGKVILESSEETILAPRFSPRGDQIAFYQRAADGSYSLAVVKASGKEKRTLAGGWSDLNGVPCWTPEGREIGLRSPDRARRPPCTRLTLRESSGSSCACREASSWRTSSATTACSPPTTPSRESSRGFRRAQTSSETSPGSTGRSPRTSPLDGKTLAFTETGEASGERPSVYLRGTDGSPALRLGEGTALAISPDGKSVLILAPPGKAPGLVLLPVGAGEPRALQSGDLESFGGGAWLPDGKRILFAANQKGHEPRIYVQELTGGPPRPIAPERTWIRPGTNPVSPDGKWFFGIWHDAVSLFAIDGGAPRPVAGVQAQELPVQWSADGRSLYVHQRRGNPNTVWQVDVADGSRRLLREITRIESVIGLPQLLMTRDGKSYVYGTYRASSELYVIDGLR